MPTVEQLKYASSEMTEALIGVGVPRAEADVSARAFVFENAANLKIGHAGAFVVVNGKDVSLRDVSQMRAATNSGTTTQAATTAPPAATHQFRSREAAMENPNIFAKILKAEGGREYLDALPATEREAARAQQAPQSFNINIPGAAPVAVAPVAPAPRPIERPAAIVEGWAPSSQAAAMENPNKFGAWIRIPGNREAFENLPAK